MEGHPLAIYSESIHGKLLPSTPHPLPLIDHGEGVYLYSDDGTQYLDGSSGALAANLGHGNKAVAHAVGEQAERVAFVHRTQFRNQAAEDLAERIAEITPATLNHSLFVGSGSEAIESAMRICGLYEQSTGDGSRWRYASRHASYHGSTLGSLSLTGHTGRRGKGNRLLHDFATISAPDLYHLPVEDGTDREAVLIKQLRDEIEGNDPDTLLAVVTETIGGASAGALVPPPGYYERVRELCDEFGILWVVDEVMSGFGRTGRWFAVEHWDAVPDLLVFGKGASGGYLPLAGVVVSDVIAEALVATRGFISVGHTFSNTPVQARAGVATVDEMRRVHAVENAAHAGGLLGRYLDELAHEFPFIGDVRGLGLMWALELVADPVTRTPFPASEAAVNRMLVAAREERLLLYPASGWLPDGTGDAVMVGPPLIITEAEILDLVGRLRRAFTRFAEWTGGCATAPSR